MRSWMHYLISYPEGYADFVQWLGEIKRNLVKDITKEAQSGDLKKLQALSIKLSIYEEIQRRIEAEFREHQSQIEQKGEVSNGG